MTTYSVRCKNSKCRHRRVTKKHPDDYKVVPKCAICGLRNGWRIEGREYNRRNTCPCGGPTACKGQEFPHNTTHPLCDHHPRGPYNQAKLRGVADEDIPLEHLGAPMKETDDCPF
jgi:hypothetical protein